VVVPVCPAVFVRAVGDWQPLLALAAQRGWPVPVVYAAGAGGWGAALGRLEAAVIAGRHDALLSPLPGVLGEAGRLMRLLRTCTRSGVLVSFAPVAEPDHTVRATARGG
jgi:hypothetical protein